MGTIKHLPAIDGLRAVAVLSVIAYHVGAPAGFVGVDVFFVISGYLITSILLREPSLPEFYARRARRILPVAFLVVLVTLALSFALLPSAGDVARSAAAAGVFVANLFFQFTTGGYWDQAADKMPLLHLWSLSVEEQFYLAWPLLLLLARGRAAWLWVVFAGSLALYAALSYFNPEAAFYQTPARAWELAAGGLVAFGVVRPVRGGLPIVLLACLVPMPVWLCQPLAVLGATLLVSSVHAGHRSVLEARPLVWVGLISYSLYLWHWPLLAIDRAVGESPLSTRLALVGVAFVLSVLTYRYVETPFRRMRFNSGRTVAFGLACAACLATTGMVMASKAPPPIKPPEIKRLTCEGVPMAPYCLTTEPKIVMWGDSYATVWMPYVEAMSKREHLPVVLFFNTGCYPTIGEAVPRHNNPVETRNCKAHNDKALAYVQKNGAEILVLTSFYAELFREHPNHPGVRMLVDALPNVKRIVIVGPTPEIKDRPENCAHKECGRTREEFLAMSRNARAALAAIPRVEVIDPTDFFCTDYCPVFRNGVALYNDPAHVSLAAVRGFTSPATQ